MNLRKIRKTLRLSQAELGGGGGFTSQYILQIENGYSPMTESAKEKLKMAVVVRRAELERLIIEIDELEL